MESIASRAQFAAAGEGPQVALFPEGTTTNGSYLLNFKVGAFKPGLPVQPVHFDYSDPLFSWTVGMNRIDNIGVHSYNFLTIFLTKLYY
jgi:1-acyl-sn-glycerol-3-phosphate acyltransferase